jgi:hypothetical protein
MRKLFIIGIIAFAGTAAQAQGFPWDIFKSRTLKDVSDTKLEGNQSG